MTRLLVVVIFVFSFVIFAGSAVSIDLFANSDNSNYSNSQNLKPDNGLIKTRLATISAKLIKAKVNHIEQLLTVILRRFSAAHERLDRISARLQSRINKLKDQGVDVSSFQTAIDGCKLKSIAVSNAIQDANNKVNAIDSASTNVKDQIKLAQDATISAKGVLLDYYGCLGNVIKIIKVTVPSEATQSQN